MDIIELIEKEDLYKAKVIISVYDKKHKYCRNEIELNRYYTKSLVDTRLVHLLDNEDFFDKINKKDIKTMYDPYGKKVIQVKGDHCCSYLHNGQIHTHGFDFYKTLNDYKKDKKKQLIKDIKDLKESVKRKCDELNKLETN